MDVLMFLSMLIIAQGASIFFLWVEVKAMQKSTHSVQYIDPTKSEEFMKLNESDEKALNKDLFDNIN